MAQDGRRCLDDAPAELLQRVNAGHRPLAVLGRQRVQVRRDVGELRVCLQGGGGQLGPPAVVVGPGLLQVGPGPAQLGRQPAFRARVVPRGRPLVPGGQPAYPVLRPRQPVRLAPHLPGCLVLLAVVVRAGELPAGGPASLAGGERAAHRDVQPRAGGVSGCLPSRGLAQLRCRQFGLQGAPGGPVGGPQRPQLQPQGVDLVAPLNELPPALGGGVAAVGWGTVGASEPGSWRATASRTRSASSIAARCSGGTDGNHWPTSSASRGSTATERADATS